MFDLEPHVCLHREPLPVPSRLEQSGAVWYTPRPMRRLLLLSIAVAMVWLGCATPPEPPPERPPEPEVEPPPAPTPPPEPEIEPYEAISLAMSLGDPDAAIAAYEEAADDDREDSPDAKALLANLYIAAGDLDQAEAVLDEVLDMEPDHETALYMKALVSGARGDREAQREYLSKLLEVNPDHPEGNAARGELALRNGNYGTAEQAFRKTLETDDDNIVALMGLGNLKLRTDEPQEAAEMLTTAIEKQPEYSFAYTDRSRAYMMQQEYVPAEKDLNSAIEMNPDYDWNYYDRGKVRLELRRYEEAVEDLTRFIDRQPAVFMAYVYRARAFDALERRDQAVADYEQALQLEPEYYRIHIPLGALYFETGQYDKARRQFRLSIDRADRDDPAMKLLVALTYKFQNQEQQALAYLEERAADMPRPSLYYDMARYYIRPGYDGYIYRTVMDQENEVLRGRMKFYLGAQYQLLERTETARAMYLDVEEEVPTGFVERRLGEFLYDRLARPAE